MSDDQDRVPPVARDEHAEINVVPGERLGTTITETLAQRLQNMITGLAPGFEPGCRLDVEAICQHFGVSATPVKQALKRLEERGLVEIKPRRGHFVTLLSEQDVREIMEARSAIEQAAIRLCAGRGLSGMILADIRLALEKCRNSTRDGDFEGYRAADVEFHRLWVLAGGNRRLIELYDLLLAQAQIVYVYVPHGGLDIGASLAEHDRLVQIAEAGNLEALEREISMHWANSVDRALARYQSYLRRGEEAAGTGKNEVAAV